MKKTTLARAAAMLALTAAAVDTAETMTTLELKSSAENCRNSEGDFALLKEGSLALFYLRKNSEADCRPVMRISKDDGKTWPIRRTLESDMTGWYCYVAALELDGDFLLGYCVRDNLRHSRIKLVPLDWLYAPKSGYAEIVK